MLIMRIIKHSGCTVKKMRLCVSRNIIGFIQPFLIKSCLVQIYKSKNSKGIIIQKTFN